MGVLIRGIFSLLTILLRWSFRALWFALCLTWRGLVALHRRKSVTFGSAQFASLKAMHQAGLLKPKGLIAGKVGQRFIRYSKPGYMLVFAKTRAGKGAGIVIPNLLTYRGSVVCTDIKGENAAITTRRRSTFGPVHVMDLEQPHLSARFNPLDMIRLSTVHQVDDAQELAELMHLPDPNADSHWDDKSTAAITALILWVCEAHRQDPAMRTLTRVRELVAQTTSDFQDTLTDIAHRSLIPYVRETAMDLLAMDGSNEMRSIKSSMDKATRLWSAGTPAALVSQFSDFNLATFVKYPQTLFLGVPEEKLGHYRRFLRVMQGSALTATIRAAKASPVPKHPPLFLLDEAASLGFLKPVEQAAGYLATYAKMILVFQDLDQLEKTYPKARSIVANAGCQVAFGINDYATAELLAKQIGQTTVHSHSRGRSQDWTDVVSHRANSGSGEAGRWLLDPSEILRLAKQECLIFMRDAVAEPIKANKVRYFEDKAFKGLWDTWRVSAQIIPFEVVKRSSRIRAIR